MTTASTGPTTDSTVTIGLLTPDVMGTYGDDGNALILRQRLRMRGISARILPLTLDQPVPDSCDLYTLGGGEDSAQILAAKHLSRHPGLKRAAERGTPILAICAGLQVLGEWFTAADGSQTPGIGILDVTTSPRQVRSIGELVSRPHPALPAGFSSLTERLTGFENHQGATTLGPQATPLGAVQRGSGNATSSAADPGADLSDGAVQGGIVATYMHGPALARNPQLADFLLARALGIAPGELSPLELTEVEQLRRERLEA